MQNLIFMKTLFTFLVIAFSQTFFAQCNTTTPKILVLGDSWAFFSWQGDSYNENCNRFGFTDMEAISNSTLSVNGSKASNFFTDAPRVQELRDVLGNNPSIEFIHFSLGGNDLLGSYHTSNSSSQNSIDYQTLMVDIRAGLDTIFSINPNLKVLISGYDYPNFEETILSFPVPSQHPFYDKWTNMGQPTAAQLNQGLLDISALFTDSCNVWNNVSFVNNLGLMQNTYGQPTNLTVAPGGSYAAGSLTVPQGLPNYPSPVTSLQFNGLDSFHLSNSGFEQFIKRHFKEYYWNALRNADATIVSSDSSLNGTVSYYIATSDSLSIGNSNANNNEVAGILSFNTASLDQSQNIQKASIFVQRESLMGNNLIDSSLTLEIKSDYFGGSLQLETTDFTDAADASSNACTYGTFTENGSWMRIDIPYELLPFINKTSTTQFRLRYANTEATNYISINNTNSNQAFLDVNYGGYSSLKEIEPTDFNIYPNPTSDLVQISNSELIKQINIQNLEGKIIRTKANINSTKITLSLVNLSKGIYIISATLESGKIVNKKIIVA